MKERSISPRARRSSYSHSQHYDAVVDRSISPPMRRSSYSSYGRDRDQSMSPLPIITPSSKRSKPSYDITSPKDAERDQEMQALKQQIYTLKKKLSCKYIIIWPQLSRPPSPNHTPIPLCLYPPLPLVNCT